MVKVGRPRASSKDVLEEAASELFLEKGYLATSIDDIAQRAGVSRATFFNYFPQKVDVLLVSVDRALDAFGQAIDQGEGLGQAIELVTRGVTRSDIPLLVSQADTMGASSEVSDALAGRMLRLTQILAKRIPNQTWQWAIAGAIAEGAIRWARGGAENVSLVAEIRECLAQLRDPSEADFQGILP